MSVVISHTSLLIVILMIIKSMVIKKISKVTKIYFSTKNPLSCLKYFQIMSATQMQKIQRLEINTNLKFKELPKADLAIETIIKIRANIDIRVK